MKTAVVDKLILIALFVITLIGAMYLIHRENLGDNEWVFIQWMMTQSAALLGAIIHMLIGGKSDEN